MTYLLIFGLAVMAAGFFSCGYYYHKSAVIKRFDEFIDCDISNIELRDIFYIATGKVL